MLCGETDIAAADIRITMNQMKKYATGKAVTGFEKQFQVSVMVTSPRTSEILITLSSLMLLYIKA